MPISPQITVTPDDIVTKNFDISAVTYTSTTATYTATGHTFSAGDVVLVSGLVPDGYNGTFTVTSVATNTFTVANTTNAAVTDPVGTAFWTATDYEYQDVTTLFTTDNNDLLDPNVNPAIAAAQTALDNSVAAAAAAQAATLAAGTAQTTANGKNTVHYSNSDPGSTPNTAGDIWWQFSGGVIIGQWTGAGGTSWTPNTVGSAVIANLDAGKISAGVITVAVGINNPSGNFSVDAATGKLICTGAEVSGKIIATSGTFTGTVNAGAGSIGGWTLSTTKLYSGTSELDATTGNAVFNKVTGFGQIYGYADLYITTTAYVGSSLEVSGSATFGSGSANPFYYLSSSGTLRSAYTYGKAVSGRTMLINSSGDFGTSASTLRKKHNVEDYEINADALLALDLKTFNYLEEYDPDQRQEFGFIAEQAEQFGLLELVQYDKDGLVDYFDYARLPVFLFQIIKKQEARIAALEGK